MVLQNDQFGAPKKGIWRQNPMESVYDDVDTDEYQYVKPAPERTGGLSQHQRLTIEHNADRTTYHYPGTDDDVMREDRTPRGRLAQDDSMGLGGREPDGQPKLFGTHRTPGHSKVYLLEGTTETDVRAMAPTMLGLAQFHAFRERGRLLGPSDDLSPHSNRMVERLQARGAVGADFQRVDANQIGFRRPKTFEGRDSFAPEHPQDVRLGRQLGRKAVRGMSPEQMFARTPEPPRRDERAPGANQSPLFELPK